MRLTQIVAQARSDPVGLAVWGVVESSISVMVGCLPALKSFFGRVWDWTSKKYTGPPRLSGPRWSDRVAAPNRVAVSDPEKSWASTKAIPLQRCEVEYSHPSSYEQSPTKSHFGDRVEQGDSSRNNSSSTTGLAFTTVQPLDRIWRA